MKNKARYPINLFLIGFILNFFKNCLLNTVMLILLFIGIWVKPCLYCGLFLLLVNIILAFIIQLRLKKTLTDGFDDTEEKKQFKDIVLDPNWVENVKDYTESKINENNEIIPQDTNVNNEIIPKDANEN